MSGISKDPYQALADSEQEESPIEPDLPQDPRDQPGTFMNMLDTMSTTDQHDTVISRLEYELCKTVATVMADIASDEYLTHDVLLSLTEGIPLHDVFDKLLADFISKFPKFEK